MIETLIPTSLQPSQGGSLSRQLPRKGKYTCGRLFRTSKPNRPQIHNAVHLVELQVRRIDSSINRYAERDRILFEKMANAYEKHDSLHANMLVDELAEIRKQTSLLANAKLSLENVASRLRAVSELGNLGSAISPLVNVMQTIDNRISRILPEVGNELCQTRSKLTGVILETAHNPSATSELKVSSGNVEKILEEVAIIAESQAKMRISESPTNKPSNLPIKTVNYRQDYPKPIVLSELL